MLSIQPSKFSYRPTIDSLKREYARRVAHMIMKKRREAQYGPRTPSKITDNSEPWLENPNSVADYWYISEQIRKSTERWQKRFNPSSDS